MRIRTIAAVLALAAGCGGEPSPAPAPRPATVLAASSLREVLEEVAMEWTRRTGRRADLRFGATSTLARQIGEGAPCDVFLAAAPEWLDRVKTLERRAWLGNRLVCVVPAGADASRFDLARVPGLALAPEEVPAGKYARAALAHLGVPLPSRVVYGANARDVLSKVVEGGAEAGIVYATDAAVEPRVRTALLFPRESHPPIVYAAGVLTEAGRPFAAALREEWALAAAARRGFEALP